MADPQEDDEFPLAVAWRDLLLSEGWRLLCQYADEQYGPAAYGRRLNAAIAAIPPGPDRVYEIAAVTDKVTAACEAVNALIARPKDQLQQLTAKKPERLYDKFRRTMETHR